MLQAMGSQRVKTQLGDGTTNRGNISNIEDIGLIVTKNFYKLTR